MICVASATTQTTQLDKCTARADCLQVQIDALTAENKRLYNLLQHAHTVLLQNTPAMRADGV